MEVINALGRRKTAVARVYTRKRRDKEDASIIINKKPYTDYFPIVELQHRVRLPLETINMLDNLVVTVNVNGGGVRGQAEAVMLGIARALCKIDIENRPPLKAKGLLRRDPRMVERKKPGQKKARKKFQFSKR